MSTAKKQSNGSAEYDSSRAELKKLSEAIENASLTQKLFLSTTKSAGKKQQKEKPASPRKPATKTADKSGGKKKGSRSPSPKAKPTKKKMSAAETAKRH